MVFTSITTRCIGCAWHSKLYLSIFVLSSSRCISICDLWYCLPSWVSGWSSWDEFIDQTAITYDSPSKKEIHTFEAMKSWKFLSLVAFWCCVSHLWFRFWCSLCSCTSMASFSTSSCYYWYYYIHINDLSICYRIVGEISCFFSRTSFHFFLKDLVLHFSENAYIIENVSVNQVINPVKNNSNMIHGLVKVHGVLFIVP